MYRLAGYCKLFEVLVVPQAEIGERRFVRAGMNRAILGTDDTPAAGSLGRAQRSGTVGPHVTHAGRMRRLVKAVGRGHRADLHGFEQDVVGRIHRHQAAHSVTVSC